VGWSFELGFGFNWRLGIRLEVGDPRAWGLGWRLGGWRLLTGRLCGFELVVGLD
jgi:hypothetical protein